MINIGVTAFLVCLHQFHSSVLPRKALTARCWLEGFAGQEQLREEPEGSQLASLVLESQQLVARLQGEEEESAILPLLSTYC